MIKPRHEKAREHFREHREKIAEGVKLLADGWLIEVGEVVAEILPTRMMDSMARSRVVKALTPYRDQMVAWARGLGG